MSEAAPIAQLTLGALSMSSIPNATVFAGIQNRPLKSRGGIGDDATGWQPYPNSRQRDDRQWTTKVQAKRLGDPQ